MHKLFGCWILLVASFTANAADTIQLWHAHQAKGFIDEVISNYTDKSDQPIQLSLFSPDKIQGELLLNAQSGALPDAIIVPSDFLGLYRELALRPIDDDWLDPELSSAARQTGTIAGQQFGIPIIQGNHLMLFYNKQLVTEPARTWQQMFQEQERLAVKQVQTIGWNYAEMYWFAAFLGAFDGRPLEQDRITLNTPAMLQALTFYRSLAERGLIDRNCNYDCAQKDFVAGRYAYAINGDWAVRDIRQELGEHFGVATLPSIGDQPLRPMRSSYVMAFPNKQHSEQKLKALLSLARHFQSDEVQQHTYSRYRLLPTNQRTFDRVLAQADAEERVILEQLKNTQPMSSRPEMALTWQALAKGYKRFMEHGYSAERAAVYMQSLADREVNKRR